MKTPKINEILVKSEIICLASKINNSIWKEKVK